MNMFHLYRGSNIQAIKNNIKNKVKESESAMGRALALYVSNLGSTPATHTVPQARSYF